MHLQKLYIQSSWQPSQGAQKKKKDSQQSSYNTRTQACFYKTMLYNLNCRTNWKCKQQKERKVLITLVSCTGKDCTGYFSHAGIRSATWQWSMHTLCLLFCVHHAHNSVYIIHFTGLMRQHNNRDQMNQIHEYVQTSCSRQQVSTLRSAQRALRWRVSKSCGSISGTYS